MLNTIARAYILPAESAIASRCGKRFGIAKERNTRLKVKKTLMGSSTDLGHGFL